MCNFPLLLISAILSLTAHAADYSDLTLVNTALSDDISALLKKTSDPRAQDDRRYQLPSAEDAQAALDAIKSHPGTPEAIRKARAEFIAAKDADADLTA